MLSGSTPILEFVMPVWFLLQVGLYGLGAVLVRELVRSRGLGWSSVLLLGAAYGVLEEGLVITSWQNPLWPDAAWLGDRGRLLDVNWIWAAGLTIYHAVVSITIPIALAEALLSARAAEPWLSAGGRRRVAVLFALVSLGELALYGFVTFAGRYSPPPLGYAVALGIAVVLLRLGLRARSAAAAPVASTIAPSLWRLRAFALLMTIAFFAALRAGPSIVPVAALDVALIALVTWLAFARVKRWSADPAWGVAQRLALAGGTLAFFVLLAPLSEANGMPSGKVPTGMTAFALAAIVFLTWLARRAPRAQSPAPASTPA